jgi:CarD family transcriptional regulator, regulator of rRNA transcription
LSIGSRGSHGPSLKLAVGDAVVYAAHGVGRVVARERKLTAGVSRDFVVVDLAAGLRVMLPVEEAAERLRAVVDDEELARVQKTLAEEPAGRNGSWTSRIRENKAKLASGRGVELAELVRDGARHDGPARGGASRLSAGERRVYVHARQLLVREICWARALGEAEADAWIEAQIGLPTEGDA